MAEIVGPLAQKVRRKILYFSGSRKKYKKVYRDLKSAGSPKIVLFNAPSHSNLGDHAITLAEIKFIKDHVPEMGIVEITGRELDGAIWGLKKIVGRDDIVAINGGGNMGTLWVDEEFRIRKILRKFRRKKIIIFPQTIYYSDDSFGKKQLKKSQAVYSKCKDLTLFAREKISEKLMKEYFPGCTVHIAPDMVLYLDRWDYPGDKNGILLCLRNDKEKTRDNDDEITQTFSDITHTDMIADIAVTKYNRTDAINDKLSEFSRAKLVVTDRLHGMIFSVLAQTPCVVILSQSHKISGVYEWIQDIDYVELIEDIEDLGSAMDKVLSVKEPRYKPEILKPYYQSIADALKRE